MSTFNMYLEEGRDIRRSKFPVYNQCVGFCCLSAIVSNRSINDQSQISGRGAERVAAQGPHSFRSPAKDRSITLTVIGDR